MRAAAAGFYPALYAFDRPVAAIYALFAAVAFGVLSPLPGSGRERAGAVLYALAPAAALTALGTALAVATAPAVAGMLVVGFVLTFASACGPRVAGAAPGLQLFYILACFPPYAPGTLPQRLAGLAAGALLLAAAELRLLPEPTAPHYADHVTHALREAAATARALARGHGGAGALPGRRGDGAAGPPSSRPTDPPAASPARGHGAASATPSRPYDPPATSPARGHGAASASSSRPYDRSAAFPARGHSAASATSSRPYDPSGTFPTGGHGAASTTPSHPYDPPAASPSRSRALHAAAQGLRFSRQPPGTSPTGAGRTHRALAQTGGAARRLLEQLAALAARPAPPPDDAPTRRLLDGIADCCTEAAEAVRGGRPARGPGRLLEMTGAFLEVRGEDGRAAAGADPSGAAWHALLRARSAVLSTALSALTVAAAVAVARGGARRAPGLPPAQFWYAELSGPRLWAVRLSGNLTVRSVVLQNAVRTALGLAVARLVAGSLDLAHGFWVLLAVLTLGRTTAVATWSAVRAAALGTLAGAVAAGLLLTEAGGSTDVYAALLVPVMALAFTVGPLGGPAWAQGMFTLVVSTAFAQLAPVTWRLAEVRVVDVLTGSAVGLLCGLLAWPAGARAEIRRGMAALLRSTAPLVGLTVEAACAPADARLRRRAADEAVRLTRHRLRIAEAVYAQYRTEPSTAPAPGDPDWLAVLNCATRVLVGAHWLPQERAPGEMPPAARRWAADAADRVCATMSRTAAFPPPPADPPDPPDLPPPAPPVPPGLLPYLVDVEVWLDDLTTDLARTGHPPSPAAPGGPGGAARR
ncbi:FUSC family protein [Streptomyces lasalocidi]|uniref:FUSC family protein n=1 Tax=Streptomyces lasalocidi TaxID=324833 RepID=UPI001F4F8E00|nr:FUSC family protein [Streptomyces lasalocidi]